MKKNHILPLMLAFTFQACGVSVLDIELPAAEPRLVVEGIISNKNHPHTISLSWSTPLNSRNVSYIDDATVIVSTSDGMQDTLQYRDYGRYETNISGSPGIRYQLDILHEGKHYQAFSTMPSPVTVDSVSIRYHEESLVREEGYYLSLHTLDPGEKEGYYRWKVWKNDTLHQVDGIPGYFATIDLNRENDWLNLNYPAPFQAGDTVRVHTVKMDRRVYRYYQGLYEMMLNDGGLMGPVPVNPETNISGNALGVFQAIYILEREFVIR